MFDKSAGGIYGRQFGTGAQARVDTEHPMAAGWCGEEQVAQVFGKDSNRLVIGGGFGLQAQFHLDGWGQQTVVCIGDHIA